MSLGQILVEKIYYSLSLFLPVVIFAIRTERQPKLWLRLSISFGLLVLLSFLPSAILFGVKREFLISTNIDMALTFLLNLVYCTIICQCCFKQTLLCSIYCSSAGYCLQHIWGRLVDYEIYIHLPQTNMGWVVLRYFLCLLCLFALCGSVYYFAIRKMYPVGGNFAENKTGQLILAVIVVGCNNFYSAFALEELSFLRELLPDGGPEITTQQIVTFINFTSAMVAFLALLCLFGFYHSKTISTEKDELNRMILEQKKKFEAEQTSINLINIKCHDLKHQLAAIEGRLSKEQINETVQAVNIYDSTVHTGNEAIDIVMASKQSVLKTNGINMSCMLDGSLLTYIPPHEIYSVFGNAIDNAIESVMKLPPEKRRIHITQEHKGNFLCIRIRNYFSGKIDFQDGLPQTTKDDKTYHGYGVKSMKLIMDKYQGHLTMTTQDDIFTLFLFFVLPEKK